MVGHAGSGCAQQSGLGVGFVGSDLQHDQCAGRGCTAAAANGRPHRHSHPQPQATPQAQIRFWADRTTITQGECTTLRWQVYNVRGVWVYPVGQNFRDFPVNGEGSRQVCPSTTTTYEMRVRANG